VTPESDDITTEQADPAEPAGEQDPAVEKEYDEAKEEAAEAEPAPDPEPEPEDPAARVQRERDEYLDLAQRTRAELENFRKRAAREAALAGERAKANLIRELLPVVDNLERALATANPEEGHLAQGVSMVHSELVATLERNGITAFDPAGEPFDPTFHEALSTRPSENGESGLVVDVVERGYRAGDAVIRPARVIVSA
jgi:molecular chaperone GrpE